MTPAPRDNFVTFVMASKLMVVVVVLGLLAVLAPQPADARALQTAEGSAATCDGVTNTLKKMKNQSINAKILSTAGSDILFGPFTSASLVIFAPTDAAWLAGIKALGINAKNPGTAGNAAIGATFFYNILVAPGSTAPTFGQPASLAAKKSYQSALGKATKKTLPLTFTKACAGCSVFANGAKTRTIIKNPIKVCNSLIYIVDTVLLPSTKASAIPVPDITGLLSLVSGFGK